MKSKLCNGTAMAGGVIVLALSLQACSGAQPQGDASAPMFSDDHGRLSVPANSPLRQRLSIEAVTAEATPHRLVLPATVEAEPTRTVQVLPPLTGRIAVLKVALGEQVKRGQLLAAIASGDMDQAYSDNAKAQDALVLAEKALARARGVQQAGGAAVKDLEAAQSGYNQALAEAGRASARLLSLGSAGSGKAGSLNLTAPMDGTVTALSVAPGAFVTDPTASIMTIEDLREVWVTVKVPENAVGTVQAGQSADVVLSAYPGQVLHGQIAQMDAVLQSDTRRTNARIVFANADGRLKPNMFATAAIDAPQPAQILVPQSALLMNNDSTTVFVETAPWVFERRKVDVGYDENQNTRVMGGLSPGERVVTRGGVLLND